MKLAILVFTNFEKETAEVRRVKMLGKGLQALGHEVHFIVPLRFSDGPLHAEIDGLKVHWGVNLPSGNWRSTRNRISGRLAAFSLARKLAAERLDWLLLYNNGLEALPITIMARWKGVKIAAEYCDLRVRPARPSIEDRLRILWQESADRIIPRLSHLNIAISRLLADWLGKLSRTPVIILPPLVDAGLFRHSPEKAMVFRARWKIDAATPLIGYLGSFWNVDGLAGLLEAAALLAKYGLHFKLSISGMPLEGRDNDDVPRLIEKFHLQEYVLLTGWLNTEEVLGALSAADILVVPKTDDIVNRAGMPTKITEYLAMSKPVVTTAVGDIPLYLQDHVNALVCPPGNATAFSQALKELIENPALRLILGESARKTALEQFDYHQAGRYLEKELLKLA